MPKHILVISQYFYPEPFRINDMCSEWVKRGYKVTVLTGVPNYPEGRFYKGYGWFKKRKETWQGVRIIRVPILSRGHSSIRLILNYYSFVAAGWFWKVFTGVKADLVFMFEVSPLTQAKVGVWYAKKRKVPCYLYVQDLWPDNLEVVGGIHNKYVLDHYGRMADNIYKHCDKIFVTSPSFVHEVRKRVFDNKDKVVYLPQYAENCYSPFPKQSLPEIPDDGRFKLIFTGNIGQAQGLGILPQAAKLLQAQNKIGVLFVIVGDGRYKEELLQEIKAAQVEDMFLFVPRQPAEKIPAFLAACDAAFLSFMDTPLFAKTIPAKLQSYMACGMPIIASANGETERIIKEAACGVCCPIGDAAGLFQTVSEWAHGKDLKTMGSNGRKYFESYFSREKFFDDVERECSFRDPLP